MSWQGSDGSRWRDGEFGWFRFIALGGPFDGYKRQWSCMPGGVVPVRVFIPLRQPGRLGPMAKYERVGDPLCEAGTGVVYREFLFDGYVDPHTLGRLADATAAIEEMINLTAQPNKPIPELLLRHAQPRWDCRLEPCDERTMAPLRTAK